MNYTDSTIVPKLLSTITTEQARIMFLKNRIYIFLRSNRGQFYTEWEIRRSMGLVGRYDAFVDFSKALDLLIKDTQLGIKYAHSNMKYIFPREKQRVW